MRLLKGDTYRHTDILRASGGRWHPSQKGWLVPDSEYARLHALVSASIPGEITRPAVPGTVLMGAIIDHGDVTRRVVGISRAEWCDDYEMTMVQVTSVPVDADAWQRWSGAHSDTAASLMRSLVIA